MHDTIAPLAYTAEQAARALNISRSSVYALLADGTIKSSFIAGRRLIPVTELHALLRTAPTPEELAAAEKRTRRAVAAVAVRRKRAAAANENEMKPEGQAA